MSFDKDELEDLSLPIWLGPNGILVEGRGYSRQKGSWFESESIPEVEWSLLSMDRKDGSTAMLDTDDGEDEDSAEIARRYYVAYLQRKALGA